MIRSWPVRCRPWPSFWSGWRSRCGRASSFVGTQPGGVDTWYYLASANALRQQKRLPIRLPQYLLHEQSESYPAVFPTA